MANIAWRNQGLRAAVLILSAAFLSACAGPSALDELNGVQPTGSAFSQALYNNYSYLARSLANTRSSEETGFFDSVDVFGGGGEISTAVEVYATKALLAAGGDEPSPEPAPDDEAQGLRNRLLANLSAGSSRFPNESARAQVDFDCWIINAAAGLMQASAQCRRSLDGSLAGLENRLRPIAPPVSAGPSGNYTVYFDFDSWTLSAEALGVLQKAIDAARSGGQSRISIVGHTDTSGDAGYNQQLSERRANVVRDVLVQMGARSEAIQVSGVGESDLEVQTGDGVREPRNRRSVVTLSP